MSELVVLEKHGRVGAIRMDHSQQGGKVNLEILYALAKAVADCENDANIGVILLMGTEKNFATGGDVREILALDSGTEEARDEFHDMWASLNAHKKPMIAAVSGYAMGIGFSLALMCDIVIAAENARFGFPNVSMGMLPIAGSLLRLSRIVGRMKAMDMVLTGQVMSADTAELSGVVSRIVPVTDLFDAAQDLAGRVASMSLPLALMVKEGIDKASNIADVDVIRQEQLFIKQARSLEDHKEGLQAVLENRQPAFQHK